MNETMQDLIDELRRLVFIPENPLDDKLETALNDLVNRMESRNASVDGQLQKLAEQTVEAEDTVAAYRQQLEALMHLTEPEAKPWIDAARMVEMVHCDAVKTLGMSDIGRELRKDVREIERIVTTFEDSEHNLSKMYGEPLSKRIHRVISFYQRTAATALSNDKAFRDDMLLWFRSFEMVVQMAGNAGTHAEKNARFRGLSELLESAAHKLQNTRVEFGYHWYDHVDVFKTDYPVRHFVEKIHELEAEVKQLRDGQKPEAEVESI